MDNFMDKLAQKWNAQEMIKANTAAETEKLNQLQNQVDEYRECLSQMRDMCGDLQSVTRDMEQQFQTISNGLEQQLRENASGLERILKERVEHLSDEAAERLEETGASIAASIERLDQMHQDQSQLKELCTELDTISSRMEEIMHRESVKVYRNVQAVMVEELAKREERLGNAVEKVNARMTEVLGVSAAALVAAVAGIVLQMMIRLQII